MKTIAYKAHVWYDEIWPRIVKDHSAFRMGEELGFVLRNIEDDVSEGFEQEMYYLDFARDEDYTLFILKFHR
jgi:aromatic ring-cleaving dioxygenase